jgi:hypothetical protein
VAFERGGQPLRIDRTAGDGGLLVAAGGEVGMQPGQLPGGGVAVADRLIQNVKALAAGLLGAQPGQPMASHRRRGADLDGQFGRVKAPAADQLPAQVGVGDPVAHQPPSQLEQGGVAVALSPQDPHQVTGQPGRHAHLLGQLAGVDGLASVDLALEPGVGDPLPGRPRISRPLRLGLAGGDGSGMQVEGHRRPPSRSGQTTRAAAPWVSSRSPRRWRRLKARSVLRPRRRSSRRAARSSARSRRACSRGA